MKEKDIIVLDNNEKFLLITEALDKGDRYFLAAKMIDDKVNEKELVLLRVSTDKKNNYVELVEDQDLIIKLSKNIKSI